MNAAQQDIIEREITVRAPKERVFNAIVDPKQIVAWFPNAVEGTMAVGETSIFDFGEDDGKHQVYVTAVDPYDYFAFRWNPDKPKGFMGDVLAHPNTLVEFRLQEVPEGTIVCLKESGFAALPADSFKNNSDGWSYMMGRLEALLNPK